MSCLKNGVKFTWKIIQQLFELTKKTEKTQLHIYRDGVSSFWVSPWLLSSFASVLVGELVIFTFFFFFYFILLSGSCASIHFAEAVLAPGRLRQSTGDRFTNAFS